MSSGLTEAQRLAQSAVSARLVPRFIGRILSFGLYGVAFAVATRYFLSEDSQRDSRWTQLYILFVMFMTTVATVVLAIGTISISVAQYRGFVFFNKVELVNMLYKVTYFIAILCTQAFLARRAYLLAVHANELPARKALWRRPSVLVLITIVPLMMIACVIGYMADFVIEVRQSYSLVYPTNLLETYGFTIATLAAAITDVTISASLGCHLIRWLREEGFGRRVNSFLRLLVVVTAGAALFTALPSVIAAILSVVSTTPAGVVEESIYPIFSDPLPQLHSISLFTTLAVRRSAKDRQPFQPTLPSLPTLLQSGSDGLPHQVLRRGSFASKGFDEDRLRVELESGGFQIATTEYRDVRGVGA